MLESLKNIITSGQGYPTPYKKIVKTLSLHPGLNENHLENLWKAYQFGESAHNGQQRKSGEPYFNHCAAVGAILAEWYLDIDTIIAGLLHDVVEDTNISLGDLENEFNRDIAELVSGVTKLSGIKFYSRQQKQAENFMKMFLSMAKDIRVIIIKFADRLHNMRTLEHLPLLKQRRIAVETRDVFAPLAHRLGMYKVKNEYEDLVLKTIEPKVYKVLLKKVKSSQSNREKYLDKFLTPFEEQMNKSGISYRTLRRTKHYYSIHGKMVKRNKKFEDIYDIMAVRIITSHKKDCYTAMGIIHEVYTPIHERFKDFIASPKGNGYQSLHTTVFGMNGRMVEVQLRTEDMDRTAEIGVAAHWAYKENKTIDGKDTAAIDPHIEWLRELVEVLQSEDKNPKEFLHLLKIDLFDEEIFVFTPRGDVIQLRTNSTPVDFAFEVHTEVGIHCIGAKVNGKIVPLNTPLINGNTVEIITSANQTPSYAWLKFVQTAKAKTHIKKWVKKTQNEQSITLGREILEKTLRRLKRRELLDSISNSPQQMGVNSLDQIYMGIASGSFTVRDIITKYSPIDTPADKDQRPSLAERFLDKARGTARGVSVDGVSNTLMNFGKCCNPIPGEEIVGYVTRGRGVTIHRNNCKNLPVLDQIDRFIHVDWNVNRNQQFLVQLKVVGEERKNFLNDVTNVMSNQNINIHSLEAHTEEGIATINMVIEVRNTRQLIRIKSRIENVNGLILLERM